jgi:hypothetical protein
MSGLRARGPSGGYRLLVAAEPRGKSLGVCRPTSDERCGRRAPVGARTREWREFRRQAVRLASIERAGDAGPPWWWVAAAMADRQARASGARRFRCTRVGTGRAMALRERWRGSTRFDAIRRRPCDYPPYDSRWLCALTLEFAPSLARCPSAASRSLSSDEQQMRRRAPKRVERPRRCRHAPVSHRPRLRLPSSNRCTRDALRESCSVSSQRSERSLAAGC